MNKNVFLRSFIIIAAILGYNYPKYIPHINTFACPEIAGSIAAGFAAIMAVAALETILKI